MAWNSSSNKGASASSGKALGPGAPVAMNPGLAGKAYHDMWDIERAYREGMQKVTWVSRCIDAIAGNQARLPIILRKDNSRDGEILTGRRALRSPLLEILFPRFPFLSVCRKTCHAHTRLHAQKYSWLFQDYLRTT